MPLVSLSQITSPLVLQAHDYWQGKRRDGLLPSRANIDPAEIPRLLPNVLLSEISLSPFEVRYRLMGTEAAAMNNLDLTGKTLHFGIPTTRWQHYWAKAYLQSLREGAVFGIDSYEYRDRGYLRFEWCCRRWPAMGEASSLLRDRGLFTTRRRARGYNPTAKRQRLGWSSSLDHASHCTTFTPIAPPRHGCYELAGDEAGIEAAAGEQSRAPPPQHVPAPDHDAVGITHGRQSVGNDQRSSRCLQPPKAV